MIPFQHHRLKTETYVMRLDTGTMNPTPTSTPEHDDFAQSASARYIGLDVENRLRQLYREFPVDRVMVTSAFAATSAYLLHLIHRVAPDQKIFFIDTGYHFPETLAYKEHLTQLYGLTVVDVRAEAWKHAFTLNNRTWQTDPDFCCSINKVEPLEALKKDYVVWVSGLMRWQTDHRDALDLFEERNGIHKFYPLLDVTREDRDRYIREHDLPFHPLVAKGYASIGCAQCTQPGQDRSGRWNNCPKTECGLHL
jgi:phosphoadenosine phosphosulfate reductase